MTDKCSCVRRLTTAFILLLKTYCGVEQDEHHGSAHQAAEARVVFVCQHIVEVTGEDSHLVNNQLL